MDVRWRYRLNACDVPQHRHAGSKQVLLTRIQLKPTLDCSRFSWSVLSSTTKVRLVPSCRHPRERFATTTLLVACERGWSGRRSAHVRCIARSEDWVGGRLWRARRRCVLTSMRISATNHVVAARHLLYDSPAMGTELAVLLLPSLQTRFSPRGLRRPREASL